MHLNNSWLTPLSCGWAIPPVRLGFSGRDSGTIPERPRKHSQSVSWNSPREYGWDPQTLSFKAFEASRASPEFSSHQYGWGRLFSQKWFQRGPLRAVVMEFPARLRAFLSGCPKIIAGQAFRRVLTILDRSSWIARDRAMLLPSVRKSLPN